MLSICEAIFQRIQSLGIAAPMQGTVVLSFDVQEDLHWCSSILQTGQLRDLPTSMFNNWPLATVHLYMDDSNAGLTVLDPALRQFIQVKFNDSELHMITPTKGEDLSTINVREQISAALEALIWGSGWRRGSSGTKELIWCWVDTTTAVLSTNNLSSRKKLAQELNGVIGFAAASGGFAFNVFIYRETLTMDDAASRAWSAPHTDICRSFSQDWLQDPVPIQHRTPYKISSANYKVGR